MNKHSEAIDDIDMLTALSAGARLFSLFLEASALDIPLYIHIKYGRRNNKPSAAYFVSVSRRPLLSRERSMTGQYKSARVLRPPIDR